MNASKSLSPLFHYEVPQKTLTGKENQKVFNRELKEEFLRLLNAGKILKLEDLIQDRLDKDGYKELSAPHWEELRTWYNNITECQYLAPLLECRANEWILHDSQTIQRMGSDEADSQALPLAISDEDYFLSWQVFCLQNQVEWNFKIPIVSFTANLHGRS